MRERTTWNRTDIIKKAFESARVAEDPRAMNQDHFSQQPAADAYTIGDSSDFAEDVAEPTWKVEYEGGYTRRTENGLPEFRREASEDDDQDEDQDDEQLEKKANLCLELASRCLPKTASERVIEDQALSFMYMPKAALLDTMSRLAAEGDEDEEETQQKQAQQQSDEEETQQKQAQQQSDEEETQQKQAQQQSDEEETQQEQKQAALYVKACQAIAQGDMQMAQQTIQQAVQQAVQQQMAQQQAPVQAQQQALSSDQVQQMVQQAVQPDQQSEDLLIDQMFQDDEGQHVASLDVELESVGMDLGTHTASDTAALSALFSNHKEAVDAAHAQALQTGVPSSVRTASTRTVGTRPSGGVSQLGGGTSVTANSTKEIEQLSGLWETKPDVSHVFNG